jgi:hypothetical protein
MATRRRTAGRAQAQVRQSQMLTTYGPGALVDLPRDAVLIGGLETWSTTSGAIIEERLQQKAARLLDVPHIELRPPPAAETESREATTGVKAWRFPEWFLARVPGDEEDERIRSRPLIHASAVRDGHYFGVDKKKYKIQPVRFVQACPNGHISDIDWRYFVHKKAKTGKDCGAQNSLMLEERGTSGDLSALIVTCTGCDARRPLTDARSFAEDAAPLGYCRGDRPWLGAHARETCIGPGGKPFPNRLLVRTASNAYFAQTLSVIHIPDRERAVRDAVDAVWSQYLKDIPNEDALKMMLGFMVPVQQALNGLDVGRVWQEIERRRSGTISLDRPIKQIELDTLLDVPAELGEDSSEKSPHFYATRHPLPTTPATASATRRSVMDRLDQVVLVHRLREVKALLGFTRFDPISADIDGELALGGNRAALARETTWLPAVETHGEGFFLSFKKGLVDAWVARVDERTRELQRGFQLHAGSDERLRFPGPRYVMLHSLSHLLISAVALECGYGASAISERIYVGEKGYGILLYTGSVHSEGTLGGLIEVGRRVDQHLMNALELGRLCSNDPVCAQHKPDHELEARYLHGAACHGCLLIAETSCERHNQLLDRSLVVPTVDTGRWAFFGGTGT